jgi:hypothetical protein
MNALAKLICMRSTPTNPNSVVCRKEIRGAIVELMKLACGMD